MNISKAFKGVCNTLQNFRFMGVTVFEIAEGSASPFPLVKGVGTKRLGKERVKSTIFSDCLLFLLFYIATCEFSMKIILCFGLLIFEVLECT